MITLMYTRFYISSEKIRELARTLGSPLKPQELEDNLRARAEVTLYGLTVYFSRDVFKWYAPINNFIMTLPPYLAETDYEFVEVLGADLQQTRALPGYYDFSYGSFATVETYVKTGNDDRVAYAQRIKVTARSLELANVLYSEICQGVHQPSQPWS